MKTQRIDIKSLVLGTFISAGIMLSVAATTNSTRPTWEYRILQGKVMGNEIALDQAINTAVADGWEFVSATSSVEQWAFAVMRREKK